MATRREAREWAVQMLFGLDLNPGELDRTVSEFWHAHEAAPELRSFAEQRVRGVWRRRAELDGLLERYSEHWDLSRMAAVDRNVMRLALYEMLHCDDIPPVVAINEAVDLAKFFNTRESGRFVNGILDRARKDLAAAGEEREDGRGPGRRAVDA